MLLLQLVRALNALFFTMPREEGEVLHVSLYGRWTMYMVVLATYNLRSACAILRMGCVVGIIVIGVLYMYTYSRWMDKERASTLPHLRVK